MNKFTALLDACVLYSSPLRNLLMHLAVSGLFQAKWTQDIHREWMKNLRKNRPDLKPEKLERTRRLMDENAQDCLVHDYRELIPGLELPDPKDRHVLAAAIRCNADVIVTRNIRDFPADCLAKYDIEAVHPDKFLVSQIHLFPQVFCAAVQRHRQSLCNPPKTVEVYLHTLESQELLVQTVSIIRNHAWLI